VLDLALGFSHPVKFNAPDGITFEVPVPTRVIVKGADKEVVVKVAASIRKIRSRALQGQGRSLPRRTSSAQGWKGCEVMARPHWSYASAVTRASAVASRARLSARASPSRVPTSTSRPRSSMTWPGAALASARRSRRSQEEQRWQRRRCQAVAELPRTRAKRPTSRRRLRPWRIRLSRPGRGVRRHPSRRRLEF